MLSYTDEQALICSRNDSGEVKQFEIAVCEDCELLYREFGVDAVLSNKQWMLIHPEGVEGLLCANCIMKKIVTRKSWKSIKG